MSEVEEFFESDTLDQKPTSQSFLAERYLRAGIPVIGGEQIYEIILNDYSRFWACRICNTADSTLDTVDSHLHSHEHVIAAFRAYKIYDAYKAEIDAQPESESWAVLYKHLIQHIREVGPLQPSAYFLPFTPTEFAKTLGIELNPKKESQDVVEEITDTINIVHCNSCNDVYFSDVDKEKAMQAKFDHYGTVNHQRCVFVKSYMKSLTLTKMEGLPAAVKPKSESDFLISAEDNIAYGPPIGFQHCIAFGGK